MLSRLILQLHQKTSFVQKKNSWYCTSWILVKVYTHALLTYSPSEPKQLIPKKDQPLSPVLSFVSISFQRTDAIKCFPIYHTISEQSLKLRETIYTRTLCHRPYLPASALKPSTTYLLCESAHVTKFSETQVSHL